MRISKKCWCCLFTCLTTRAVDIEVVSSLEAEACLAAITKIVTRRGKLNIILSDNGTSFVGAANEMMREWIEVRNQLDIEQSLARKQIKWKFNSMCTAFRRCLGANGKKGATIWQYREQNTDRWCTIHNHVYSRTDIEFKTSD